MTEPPAPAALTPEQLAERQRWLAADRERAAALEGAYRRWDELRARDAAPAGGAGPFRRLAGALPRLVGRLRGLGLARDLERDLLRGLLDRQAALAERLIASDLANDDLACELATRDGALRAQEAALADLATTVVALTTELRAAGAARDDRIADLAAVTHRLTDTAQSLRQGLAALRETLDTLWARQHRLEHLTSPLPTARSADDESPPPEPLPPPLPFTPGELDEILADLSREVVSEAEAVVVSFQDVRAEPLLRRAHEHFGTRLSAAGTTDRSPNDLWLHVDASPHWCRPQLLENAAARLASGGHLVLVTNRPEPAPSHPELELTTERELTLTTATRLRRLVWRRR